MSDAKRLTGLQVNEISLVDKPAIVERFIVTKRGDQPPAPVEKNDAAPPADTTTTADPPAAAPTATTKADDPPPAADGGGTSMPVHEALVQEKVQAISAGLQKLVADLSSGAVDADECRERMWAIQDLCWALCRDAAALNVAKSVDGPAKIGKTLETIQKARDAMRPVEKAYDAAHGKDDEMPPAKAQGMKKFTKARVEKLSGALQNLHEVLSEIAPNDVAKALSTDVAEDAANAADPPPAAEPTATTKVDDPPPAAVEKNDTAGVDQIRTDLKKAQDDAAAAAAAAVELQKRLDKLEAVGIGKALTSDTATDPEPVKKGMWSGFLEVPKR